MKIGSDHPGLKIVSNNLFCPDSGSGIHGHRDEDGPGTKTCWQFDEIDGNYNYTHEIPDTEFGHKHNPMAMYDENPLGVLSN